VNFISEVKKKGSSDKAAAKGQAGDKPAANGTSEAAADSTTTGITEMPLQPVAQPTPEVEAVAQE